MRLPFGYGCEFADYDETTLKKIWIENVFFTIEGMSNHVIKEKNTTKAHYEVHEGQIFFVVLCFGMMSSANQ